ncbi:MAG TPA: DUF2071 domain-containing protein [Gaiellaceae bacterium]|nr:DUF2071 domain-containing protein [Gaiellaceae bacterium]
MSDLGMIDSVARQQRLASETAGRPWPLPDVPWSQAETRRDLMLAHWRVELSDLARLLPPGLAVDTHAGAPWLGISAFRVESFRLRGLPPFPTLSSARRLETFTYVTVDGRPGLWHFSIEVSNRLHAEAAKRTHRLPAYRAQVRQAAGSVEAERDGYAFRAEFRDAGEPFEPLAGSLDHFLTERYALYTEDGGRLYRAEVNHGPWSLRRATATVTTATLAPLPLEGEPHALTSRVEDILLWPLEEIG